MDKCWNLAQGCARAIYTWQAPSEQYADRVARQLFGTCAAESMGRWRRQMKFRPAPEDLRGAFGLWQCEKGSVLDSLKWLSYKPAALDRARAWLNQYGDYPALTLSNLVPILVHLQTPAGDPLACLLGRLHYARYPVAIPETLAAQARYWLHFYNGYGNTKHWVKQGYTPHEAEAASCNWYVERWQRLCAPIAGEPGG